MGANERDTMSSLIHRIFSFGVELNEVVETSVLSKRWVSLWRTYPNLNFTSLGLKLGSGDAKYLNFITKFLLGRAQQVETCSVHIDLDGINESVGGIVLLILFLAVSHSLEKLHMSSDSFLSFHVSKELSLCQCYVSLTKWTLPCLTNLYIGSLRPHSIIEQGCGEQIIFRFNQFHCLNNLSLAGCFGLVCLGNPEFLRINLPNLETLTILHVNPIQFPECKFVISTPKLKSFSYHGRYAPLVCAEGGFPCLEQVLFSFNVCKGEKMGLHVYPGMYSYYDNLELDEYQVNEIMLKISSLFSAFRKITV